MITSISIVKMALDKMASYTFKKGNASSCLVMNKAWKDIVGKPDFFDTIAKIMVEMLQGAEETGLLLASTSFTHTKDIINKVLISPLMENKPSSIPPQPQTEGTILADAFWDELIQTDEILANFKTAIERAYAMKLQIQESAPLSNESDLGEFKETINSTILKPLNAINEDE